MRSRNLPAVLAAGAIMASLGSGEAHAQQRTLKTPDNTGNVLLWRDGKALDEGLDLIRARVHQTNPDLVMRLLSCAVPSGTQAVVVSGGGFSTRNVLVTEGPNSGCRGTIPFEFLR